MWVCTEDDTRHTPTRMDAIPRSLSLGKCCVFAVFAGFCLTDCRVTPPAKCIKGSRRPKRLDEVSIDATLGLEIHRALQRCARRSFPTPEGDRVQATVTVGPEALTAMTVSSSGVSSSCRGRTPHANTMGRASTLRRSLTRLGATVAPMIGPS